MNIDEPLIALDRDGAHVTNSDVAEKLEKKNLSASLITGLNSCGVRWLAETFVLRDLIEETPDNAARRGSLFHKVMEDFFKFPAEERNPDLLKKVLREVINSEEFSDLSDNPEVIAWLKDAINGYYSMGGRPKKVEVAEIPIDGKEPKQGLEMFVKGKIGETDREILGFIDRLVVDQRKDDGSVIIEDWKTGAKTKRWNPKTKSDEGLAEQRQQIIYKMLLEKQGVKVSGARLLYPVAREVVNVDLKDEELAEKVVKDVEDTDKALTTMTDNNTFEYGPSFLCAWCPLAKLCPFATIKPYEKMQKAFASQPDPEDLLKGIELR